MMRQAKAKRSTSSCPFFCAIANLMNWMFAKYAAIVTPDSTIDTPNTQQFSQKHSFASFSDATMNFSRCCFARITITEIRNPMMQPTPHTRVSSEYLLIYDFCISLGRKGSLLPKKRQRKPAPKASIRRRERGMQRQAETEGRQQVVSTSKMQTAVATPSPIRMSGITCSVERQGMSCPFVFSSRQISASLRCSAEFASTDSATTTPTSTTYSRQQKESVHFRSRLGPSRHCTCSWIYCSSSSIIQNYLQLICTNTLNSYKTTKATTLTAPLIAVNSSWPTISQDSLFSHQKSLPVTCQHRLQLTKGPKISDKAAKIHPTLRFHFALLDSRT